MGAAARPGTGVRRDATVRIARNMDVFIAGADGVEPVPRKDIKASLLMQGFELSAVSSQLSVGFQAAAAIFRPELGRLGLRSSYCSQAPSKKMRFGPP